MTFDFDELIDRRGTESIKWAGGDRIALGLADMDFRTAPAVLEALRDRVDHGIFGYTEVADSALAAIISWLSRRQDWAVDPDWITVTPGVLPSMAHLLRATVPPNAAVIVQTPGFMPIRTVIEANGYRCLDNPLIEVDGRYRMDLAGFSEIAARPDVDAFVLCSPHNPVGRIWSRGELEEVALICEAENLLVISDEIHAEIVFPGRTFTPYANATAGSRHATLLGPSKGFNLAGLRTSVTIIADPDLRSMLRAELHRVNEDFSAPLMGMVALEAAYSQGGEWLEALTRYLQENVTILRAGLATEVPAARIVEPDASFLVWTDLRGLGFEDQEIESRLGQQRVAIEPGVSFGPDGRGFGRINVGTPRSRLIEAVERIGRALRPR